MGSVDDVLRYIATNEIRWIDLQFSDIAGNLHKVSVSNQEITDTSFVKGVPSAQLNEVFGAGEQGELILLPDPDTVARIPWETSAVRLVCDVMVAVQEERYLKDPRYVSERIEANLTALGLKQAKASAEVEFRVFDTATTDRHAAGRGTGTIVDSREALWSPSTFANVSQGAYLSQPFDTMYPARIQISETLEENFGYQVDGHNHGAARTAQQSIRLGPQPLKSATDALMTLKFVARNLANTVSAACTFMPYPVYGERGNALNLGMSLWKTTDSNVFYDASAKYAQLSQVGR